MQGLGLPTLEGPEMQAPTIESKVANRRTSFTRVVCAGA